MDLTTFALLKWYVSNSITNAEINNVTGKSTYEIVIDNDFFGSEKE
jgi:hypothetical protein